MIVDWLDLIGIAIFGMFLGVGARVVIQRILGQVLGSKPQFSRMRYVLWQVNYGNIGHLTNSQIRGLSGWVLAFPLCLFIITLSSPIPSARLELFIASILIGGTITITWKDLLAISSPNKWTSYSGYLGIRREPTETKIESLLPSLSNRPLTYLSFLISIGLLVTVLLVVQGDVGYIDSSATPAYTFESFTRGVGALGSIFLSILLVILYDKQASISKEQTTIQKEQKDLMQRDREPHLSGPYNFRIWGGSPVADQEESEGDKIDQQEPSQEPNPNSLQFYQTNAGDGLAKNFRLFVHLTIDEGPHEGRTARCAVQRTDRKPLHKFGESDLQGGEQDIKFITEELQLQFSEPDPGEHPSFQTESFEKGINKLYEENTRKISLVFTLKWENEVGEEQKDQFDFMTSEISSDMDFIEFYLQE